MVTHTDDEYNYTVGDSDDTDNFDKVINFDGYGCGADVQTDGQSGYATHDRVVSSLDYNAFCAA